MPLPPIHLTLNESFSWLLPNLRNNRVSKYPVVKRYIPHTSEMA